MYQTPPPGYQPPLPVKAAPAHDGLAITSFVLSLVWLFGLGSLLAVIFGHRSRGESKRAGRATSALATAGTVIGYVGLVGAALSIALIAAAASSLPPVKAPAAAAQVSNPANTQPAVAASSAPPAVVTVHFSVTGTGAPSITYGSDSDNRTPPGTAGPLGDGVPLPWHGHLRFDAAAQYYDISAQLEGSGNISCRIWITAPGYQTLTVARGHASGGYNICDAQAAPNDTTGLNWSSE